MGGGGTSQSCQQEHTIAGRRDQTDDGRLHLFRPHVALEEAHVA